jgi:NADPH:quinone reductase-like Zn-dependent oxidoreductase
MRAVTIPQYGGPEVLVVAEVPIPEPGPDQIRITTVAAAVNPVDAGVRSGRASAAVTDPVFPLIPGWDVAGVVDAVGPGAERFEVGQDVIGVSVWFMTRRGTHAEYVVLDESACAPAPSGVDPTAAATLPLNGLTAWSALITAKVAPGDRLLVTGAAGGVGGYLVELARARGITVIGHGRSGDRATVLGLGADEFTDDLSTLSGVAAAIDTTGKPDAVLAVMGADGRLVTLSGKPSTERPEVTVKAGFVRPDPDALAEMAAMAAGGTLTLRVAEVLALEESAEAHRRLEAGGTRGRFVLRP